ncbi:MAG: hypothetical protein RR133_05505 [Kiritimatiellia bacterium]
MRGKDFIYFVIGLIVLYSFCQVIYDQITGKDPESIARMEEEVAKNAEAQKVFEKEDARRTFALKESPVLWKTISELKAAIIAQNSKLEKLKKTFDDLGLNAETDADYLEIKGGRDKMILRLCDVEEELDKAYLSAVKYEVAQGKAEKVEFERKASDDGLSEASQSRAKYDAMRKAK